MRDALLASAAAGEFAEGLDLLASCSSGDSGDSGAAAPSPSSSQLSALCLRPGVQRVAAVLHAGSGDVGTSLGALRKVRSEDPTLGLSPSEFEAIALACAKAGRWRHVRWLLRASHGGDAHGTPLTQTAAAVALAACACMRDGPQSSAHSSEPLPAQAASGSNPSAAPASAIENPRRLALAGIATRCAAQAEGGWASTPGARDVEVPHAVIEWSALALRARLNALCAPGAPVEPPRIFCGSGLPGRGLRVRPRFQR